MTTRKPRASDSMHVEYVEVHRLMPTKTTADLRQDANNSQIHKDRVERLLAAVDGEWRTATEIAAIAHVPHQLAAHTLRVAGHCAEMRCHGDKMRVQYRRRM